MEDFQEQYNDLKKRISHFGSIFDVEGKRAQLQKIEERISDPAFWGTAEDSQKKLLQKRSQLADVLTLVEEYQDSLGDLQALIELYNEGEDVVADVRKEIFELERRLSATEVKTLLSGPHDPNNAIVTIHPGAGGTESQDWAEMLLRMYLRWAERHGRKTEVTDYQVGEEAGIRSVTFLVQGKFAYGYLSPEIGVHRLVRISPFDAGARRHTSFASVFITPEIEEDVDIVIDEKDLRIDTYRSSGAGGQHVNVTDSAVRLTHIPTGVVVQCQNERSQHRNKATAMKILKSRLYELEMEKKRKELDKLEESKAEIAWGSQIRSYVLHPYRLVKDHRTKLEAGDVDSVLDGKLDPFISAYLKQKSQEKSKEETKK
ncbi:peptide chain release factor 2 [Acidobacteria bacterium AH-259-O06]|nr:peptide chain release factor 2 [Acidobacteria bacterium AH-259-O06]